MRRPASLLVGLVLTGTMLPNALTPAATLLPSALAQWQATVVAGAASRSTALTLAAGSTPVATVPAASSTVTVTWTAPVTGAPPSGYDVRVYDATSGTSRAITASCTGLVTVTSCVETTAPDGTWRYAITPRQQSWSGVESPRSTAVVVDSSYRALVLSDSPVAYWRLGETSGTTATDERGANNGTYSGGYVLGLTGALAGDANAAVDLNGTTGVITVPSVPALELTNQVSLEAWVNPDSLTGTRFIINKGTYYYLYTANGTTYFGVHTPTAYTFITSTALKIGSWQHLVGTYDGASLKLYRNGVIVAQSATTGAITTNAAVVALGALGASPTSGVDGGLDEPAVYGTALSGAQVLAHYQRGNHTRPEVAITFPVAEASYQNSAWTSGCAATTCGIALDTGGGVAAVTVSIRQGTGNYWNGTAFASATEVLVPATGTTSWSRAFPVTNFPADGSYTVRAVGADTGGNTATATSTFTIDNVAPAMAPYLPVAAGAYNTAGWNNGCSAQACGVITDAVGGVATAVLSLRQGTGNYWNGTAFASATEVMVAAYLVPGFWVYGFTTSSFPADGAYTLRAVGTDKAGNATSLSTSFTIDRVSATVALTVPASAATYNTASWNAACTSTICGTSSDAGGVAGLAVSIRQGTGNYWNGTSFSSAADMGITASGTTNWSLPFPASNFPTDGAYTVYAVAADAAGNISFSSVNTFTIDRTAPTPTAVTFFDADGTIEQTIDEVRITYSEVVKPSSICSTWSGTGDQTLTGTGVVVTITDSGTTDPVSATATACTLNIGSIATGQNSTTGNATFSGTSPNDSRIVWTAATRTLTIHFGTRTAGTLASHPAGATAVYTPNALITDVAGNAIVTTPLSSPSQRF